MADWKFETPNWLTLLTLFPDIASLDSSVTEPVRAMLDSGELIRVRTQSVGPVSTLCGPSKTAP
jgi:hypothetical protein